MVILLVWILFISQSIGWTLGYYRSKMCYSRHTIAKNDNVCRKMTSSSNDNTADESLTYDKQAWREGYVSCKKETCEMLSNNLDLKIQGTYFRNGPACFEHGRDKFSHPFDGDGMIIAITFQDGKVFFRNRFVRTQGYTEEEQAGKILHRGAFRAMRPGGIWGNIFRPKIKNVANTNVIYWAGKLLALWEAGRPHALAPDTLVTEPGEFTFNNLVTSSTSGFSVHPKVCSHTGRLVGFASQQGLSDCKLTVYEFDEVLRVQSTRSITIPGFAFFHDFLLTENYYIFLQAPVDFDVWAVVLGVKPPAECMTFREDRPSKLYIVPRNPEIAFSVLEVDAHFVFHFANAYEKQVDDFESIIVFDSFRCDSLKIGVSTHSAASRDEPAWIDMDYGKNIPFPLLMRYKLSRKGQSWNYEKVILSRKQLDFATINPNFVGKEYRYIYAMSGSSARESTPFQGYVKIDLQGFQNFTSLANTNQGIMEHTYMPLRHEFLGEPLFIGKTNSTAEDDGYLVSILFDGKAADFNSYLVVFDAQHVEAGPIVKLPIRSTKFPLGLHSSFARDLVVDDIESVIKSFQ